MPKPFIIVFGIAATLAMLIILAKSYDDNLPPHWVNVCTSSHQHVGFTTILSNKAVITVPHSYSVCDSYELKCKAGINYKGMLKCH